MLAQKRNIWKNILFKVTGAYSHHRQKLCTKWAVVVLLFDCGTLTFHFHWNSEIFQFKSTQNKSSASYAIDRVHSLFQDVAVWTDVYDCRCCYNKHHRTVSNIVIDFDMFSSCNRVFTQKIKRVYKWLFNNLPHNWNKSGNRIYLFPCNKQLQ